MCLRSCHKNASFYICVSDPVSAVNLGKTPLETSTIRHFYQCCRILKKKNLNKDLPGERCLCRIWRSRRRLWWSRTWSSHRGWGTGTARPDCTNYCKTHLKLARRRTHVRNIQTGQMTYGPSWPASDFWFARIFKNTISYCSQLEFSNWSSLHKITIDSEFKMLLNILFIFFHCSKRNIFEISRETKNRSLVRISIREKRGSRCCKMKREIL